MDIPPGLDDDADPKTGSVVTPDTIKSTAQQATDAFISSRHAHHSDEIHFECKVFHGNCNVTVAVFVPVSCA